MHRSLALLLGLWACAAAADIPPPNSEGCEGKQAGAQCTMDDGRVGKCVSKATSRPDYSSGIPPKSRTVQVMICEPAGGSVVSRVSSTAWLLGLAMAAVGALWLGARRSGGRRLRPT